MGVRHGLETADFCFSLGLGDQYDWWFARECVICTRQESRVGARLCYAVLPDMTRNWRGGWTSPVLRRIGFVDMTHCWTKVPFSCVGSASGRLLSLLSVRG